MDDLVKVIKKPEPPMSDVRKLALIRKNPYQDYLHIYISILPLYVDVKDLTPSVYQTKEAFLGKPTVDIAIILITTGVKEVFKQVEKYDTELVMLWKQNEPMRGQLHRVLGPIDLDNPKNHSCCGI